MKNDLQNRIPGNCISKTEMISYLKKSAAKEAHFKISKHLQSCEYCSEALKGLEQVPDLAALNALSIAWKTKTGIGNSNYQPKNLSHFVYAGISIAVIISGIIFFNNISSVDDDKSLALKEKVLNINPENRNIIPKEKETIENALSPTDQSRMHSPSSVIEKKSDEGMTKIPLREAFTIDEAPVVRALAGHLNSNIYPIVYIENLKTVDYSKKYKNNQPELDKLMPDVSARFENKEQQLKAMNESRNQLYSLKYENVLAMGLRNMNKGLYNNALANFDLILQFFPEDMNCNFYKALTYEKMDQLNGAENLFANINAAHENAFGEEAKYHLGIVMIKLNKISEARKILEDVTFKNGFYKSQALEKLKEINEKKSDFQ